MCAGCVVYPFFWSIVWDRWIDCTVYLFYGGLWWTPKVGQRFLFLGQSSPCEVLTIIQPSWSRGGNLWRCAQYSRIEYLTKAWRTLRYPLGRVCDSTEYDRADSSKSFVDFYWPLSTLIRLSLRFVAPLTAEKRVTIVTGVVANVMDGWYLVGSFKSIFFFFFFKFWCVSRCHGFSNVGSSCRTDVSNFFSYVCTYLCIDK